MYIASDLAKIARNNGLSSVPGVDQAVGVQVAPQALRSFTTLGSDDGVYYAKALGVIVVTKDGVDLDGIDFRGVSLNIRADDVTIRNCAFDASSGIYAINAFPDTKNLTVDHSTFDGLKLDNPDYVDFIVSRGTNTVLTNNAFLDAPTDAVTIQSGTIRDNYFAGASYATGAHADAIWISKTTSPVLIENNTIDWRSRADAPNETNNPVRITGENGDVSNVTVTGNIILGGSMTVLVSDGATQTHNADEVGSVRGVKIVDNVVDYGKYGSLEATWSPADLIYADNVHASGLPKTPGIEATGALPNLAKLNLIDSDATSAFLRGTGRADYMRGGDGGDWLSGGGGNDVIEGGDGRDHLIGGAGADIFVYRSVTASGHDLMSDFQSGVDRIDLATLAGAPKRASDWQWLGSESFTGHAWQLRYQIGPHDTTVQVDVDGDLKADFQIQMTSGVRPALADFILGHAGSASPTPPAPEPEPTGNQPDQPAQEPTSPTVPDDETGPSIVLEGNPGGGYIRGSSADEHILGSSKADNLRGGGGDDLLQGDLGRDFLYGGSGADTFKFTAEADSTSHWSGRDYVGDFVNGEDRIDLRELDGNVNVAGHQDLIWIGESAFDGQAGELRYVALTSRGGQVQADLDGDGNADFAFDIVAKMPLDLSDFVL